MNLVNELQEVAEKQDVLTALRNTKRLASKLGRQDILDWIKGELEGYAVDANLPDYRRIYFGLAYKTNGVIPAGWGRVQHGVFDLPSLGLLDDKRRPIREPISVVLNWIKGLDSGTHLYLPINEGSGLSHSIREIYGFDPTIAQQVSFLERLNESQIEAIPERIKDTVLDWALALERAGVTGDGMSFSATEKQIAHNIVFYINNSTVDQITTSGTNQKVRT
jgi:hypothetical protein